MLTASDLIHLAYTLDLTESGIAYVCRTLALSRQGKGEPSFRQLRRSIAGVAAELALRRYLQGQAIRYKTLNAAPFAEPDRYEISLAGHRCKLVTYFISHQEQVISLQQNPELYLQAPALLASDEFAAKHHWSDDLYLFAFVLGSESSSGAKEQSNGSGPGAYWIHLLPRQWAMPFQPISLHKFTLKNESEKAVLVDLGGLNSEHEFLTSRLDLLPGQDRLIETPFASLATSTCWMRRRRACFCAGQI